MRSFLPYVLASLALPLLTGCSLTSATPVVKSGGVLEGRVHGGQQPIANAKVYLLAAETSGYGQPSVPLLDGPGYVLTDAGGNFHLTGHYTCTAGQQVYAYVSGGDTGSGNNSSVGLMSALGNCPGGDFTSTVPFIYINEVSTIAAAYALAGFATDATHISSSNTALAKSGIASAFVNTTNLVDMNTGAAYATTPHGSGTVPQAEINTLANILAACVNTNDSDQSICNALFGVSSDDGTGSGVFPTETATAAINIAHHPVANVDALCSLQLGIGAPFQPALSCDSSQFDYPYDFSLSLTFTDLSITGGPNLALDSAGDVWLTNPGSYDPDPSFDVPSNVTRLSSNGTLVASYPFADTGAFGLAIDSSDNAWVTQPYGGPTQIGSLTKVTAGGVTTEFDDETNFEGPFQIVIDGAQNNWVLNLGDDNLLAYDNSGAALTGSPFSGNGLYLPGGGGFGWNAMAIDNSNNIWVANSSDCGCGGGGPADETVSIFDNTGAPVAGSPFTPDPGNLHQPVSMIIDGSNNAWIGNFDGTITVLDSTGTLLGGAPLEKDNLNAQQLAVDGDGHIWAANTLGTIYEMSGTGEDLSGDYGFFSDPQVGYTPLSLAIDSSGNIWTNDAQGPFVHEFIGIAAPTTMPLSVAIHNHTIGVRP